MKGGISACIIGKNEEVNLDRCLKSIADVVQEIIYVDTGSSDNSISIVESYKGKVFRETFDNDFSKVRNKCISYASYSWILSIDCDEQLSEDSKGILKSILEIQDAEALLVNIINVVNGEAYDKFPFPRLFKNKKEYYFQGKIHEQIAPSIVKLNGLDALKEIDIDILHYGYNSDAKTELKKHKRNLQILNSIGEEERNDFYYYNLGNEYSRVNNYKAAIDNYEKAIQLIKGNEAYTVLLYERLAHFYYLTQQYEKCINLGVSSAKIYLTHMYFYYIVGLSYIEQMKFTKAYESLIRAKVFLEHTMKDKNYVPLGFGITNKSEMYEAIEELKECMIQGTDNLITTIIDCRNHNSISEESIKSINEISSEIIVVVSNENKDDKSGIVNYRLVKYNSNLNIKEVIKELAKEIKTDYILYLKNKEGLTLDDEKAVIEVILNNNFDYLPLFNINDNKNEIRLVKKSKIYMISKNYIKIPFKIDISYFE